MSAFICSDSHINALAYACSNLRVSVYVGELSGDQGRAAIMLTGGERHLHCFGRAQEIANVLLVQNYASVNYRYRERSNVPPVPYRIESRFLHMSPVALLKLADCYAYQSCETEDWKQTLAFAVIDALKNKLICALPGYEAAAWALDDAPNEPTVISLYDLATSKPPKQFVDQRTRDARKLAKLTKDGVL